MVSIVYAILGFVVGALFVLVVATNHSDCNVTWRPELEIVREHLRQPMQFPNLGQKDVDLVPEDRRRVLIRE